MPVWLTPRQTDVLRLMAEGLSNREIARRLNLREKSVTNYTNQIYQALHLTGALVPRTKAVVWYLRDSGTLEV